MTYEYICGGCAHTCEANQSINDKPKRKCPECGKMKLKRLVSGGSGFTLQGGGWGADGYSSTTYGTKDKARFNDMTKSPGEQ